MGSNDVGQSPNNERFSKIDYSIPASPSFRLRKSRRLTVGDPERKMERQKPISTLEAHRSRSGS